MESDEDFNDSSLDSRCLRKVYMITYSQAEAKKCPDRESFAHEVLQAFDLKPENSVRPLHWAVCKENHKIKGFHYHMCIKLSDNKRWLGAKKKLLDRGINVNFREGHRNYITAYRYLKKYDKDILLSESHPDLDLAKSPKTSKMTQAWMRKRQAKRTKDSEEKSTPSSSKQRRLNKMEVMDIMKEKGIKSETQLFALAQTQANEGMNELKSFIANTPERVYKELISKTWKLVKAPAVMKRAEQNRMEVLANRLNGECISGCGKLWLQLAMQVLKNNKIHSFVFADAVRNLLENGRGKNRNILIIGPANCGKTFLLNPLNMIYRTFVNPAGSKFAFVGAQDKELIFLNDLRWNPDMIPWQDFLNLLEGQKVHLAAPKTHYAEDIFICSDIPIFATSISSIKFLGRSSNVEGENAMMDARWRIVELFHQIPVEEQKSQASCPRCFAELIMMGRDDE